MKSGTIKEYVKGGVQELCNYQSTQPFVKVQEFISRTNANENETVKIVGGMVIIRLFIHLTI